MEGASQACAQFQSIFNFTTQSVDSKREIFDQQKRGSLEPVCGKGGEGASSAPVATPPSLLACRNKHKRAVSWAGNINLKYWPHYLKKFHSFSKNNQSKLHNFICCVAKFIAIIERQYISLTKHFTFSQCKRASFIRWVRILISHNDQSKWNLVTRPITLKTPRFPWNSVIKIM